MILITGTTGLLGFHMLLYALERGLSVVATYRDDKKRRYVEQLLSDKFPNLDCSRERIIWVRSNLKNPWGLDEFRGSVDEVYHAAAHISFDPREKQMIYTTNIETTKNLLEWSRWNGVKKFCFVSSIAALGEPDDDGWITEKYSWNSHSKFNSIYAWSKYLAEMEVFRAQAEGLNTVIINPGVILGSHFWDSPSASIFRNATKMFNFFTTGVTGVVDVRDVAKAAFLLMEKECFGERFAIVAGNISFEKLTKTLAALTHQKYLFRVPSSLLWLGAYIASVLKFIIPPLSILNEANVHAITSNTKISNKKFLETTNYQFIPIEESLKEHMLNYLAYKKTKTS